MNIPLNIDWQQIILHLLNFAILAGGLYFLLYHPVRKFMDQREEHYRQMENEAQQRLDQAKATVFADPRISSVNRNKEIIRLVHEQGIFKMKNAVPKVAQELGVSKNTVYLHLRSLKNADHAEA